MVRQQVGGVANNVSYFHCFLTTFNEYLISEHPLWASRCSLISPNLAFLISLVQYLFTALGSMYDKVPDQAMKIQISPPWQHIFSLSLSSPSFSLHRACRITTAHSSENFNPPLKNGPPSAVTAFSSYNCYLLILKIFSNWAAFHPSTEPAIGLPFPMLCLPPEMPSKWQSPSRPVLLLYLRRSG